jgi:glutaredoxin 3
MTRVEIYTKNYCPFCARAKALLDRKNIGYEEIDVTVNPSLQVEMQKRSQRRTVPQIFIDGVHVGGSDDLIEAERSGALDRLLAGQATAA